MNAPGSRQVLSGFQGQSGVHDLNGERRQREKSISEYLAEHPNGNRCSRCGDVVSVGAGVDACVCAACTRFLSDLAAKGYFRRKEPEARRCPDCGGPMEPKKQHCGLCAKKRRRESNRRAQKNRRKKSR